MSSLRRIPPAILALALTGIAALHFTGLTSMGLYSTDEPRYAAIGQAMAATSDYITPRLWTQPWFEKTPLVYWLAAAGYKLGLGPELAPRLPIALLSALFLLFFWHRVRRLWDDRTAAFATAILATSAGWLAYSRVAVMDAPLTVLFNAALLFTLSRQYTLAALALGLASLTKGLVPLVLFFPVIVWSRNQWRQWLRPGPVAAFALTAFPWYVLTALKNGPGFLHELVVVHQLGRFTSPDLQHLQHWYFYFGVLLLLLFPWSPLVYLSVRRASDTNSRLLAAVFLFGFVFFSAAANKLPGYILPLLPSLAILIANALAQSVRPERHFILPVTLLGALPACAAILPEAALRGLSSTTFPWTLAIEGMGIAAAFGIAIQLLRQRAAIAAVATAGLSFLALILFTLPSIDRLSTARPLWLEKHPDCAPSSPRNTRYSLYYYAGKTLPDCVILDQNPLPAGPK